MDEETDSTETISLGLPLRRLISLNDDILDIVERPSAGYITVSRQIGQLIGFALLMFLSPVIKRGSRRVRIGCTIDHRRLLRLSVINDDSKVSKEDDKRCSTVITAYVLEHGITEPTQIEYQAGSEHIAILAVQLSN